MGNRARKGVQVELVQMQVLPGDGRLTDTTVDRFLKRKLGGKTKLGPLCLSILHVASIVAIGVSFHDVQFRLQTKCQFLVAPTSQHPTLTPPLWPPLGLSGRSKQE